MFFLLCLFLNLLIVFFILVTLAVILLFAYGAVPALYVGLLALLVFYMLAACLRYIDRKQGNRRPARQAHTKQKGSITLDTPIQQLPDRAGITQQSEAMPDITTSHQNTPKVAAVQTQQYASRPATALGHQNTPRATDVQTQQGCNDIGIACEKAERAPGQEKPYLVKVKLNGGTETRPSIYIYRDGDGTFEFAGSKLFPVKLKEGETLSKSQYDMMKAYEMFRLFNTNSDELVGHKILKIIPVTIQTASVSRQDGSFDGTVVGKGCINVDHPINGI